MQIELGPDGHVRPDDVADPRQQITFAIVVPVGDHRAVQEQQHAVHRQRRTQIRDQLVAQ
jgi:hypothetical protein